jgi:hypothetical protein
MRGFGWFLVVLGLILVVGYPMLAAVEYNANVSQWAAEGKARTSAARARRQPTDRELAEDYVHALRYVDRTPKPASWTPGLALGGGLFALGVIVLEVRRPERGEE